MMMSKFALVLIAAAALCVTTVSAYTGGGKIRDTTMAWDADETVVTFSATTPNPAGYVCIGIVYSTGSAHNNMDTMCTYQNKFYRGYCGGGKSAPNFKNPNGNNNGDANGMGVLTAMTLTNNNGNQVATWTRPLANSYTGTEDVRVASVGTARYLDQEMYFEPNKEYMLWVAESSAGNGLDKYHSGASSMNNPMFTGSAPPLAKPTCDVYRTLWGGCPVTTMFNGEPSDTVECNQQNDCTYYDCCALAPPAPTPPTPEVTYTPTPAPDDSVGPANPPVIAAATMARCPANRPCGNTDWERLVDHGDNFCSGPTAADCTDADCCTCVTKAKGNICAAWRLDNQMSTQADLDNSAFGVSPSVVTLVFALVGVVVMVF